jgi:hypothetical protein
MVLDSDRSYLKSQQSIFGGGNRIRTGGKGFADLCLTTWLCRRWSGRRDSNPRPPPWQGGVLPLNYFRNNQWILYIYARSMAIMISKHKMGRPTGIEPANVGTTIRCVNHFATIAINFIILAGVVGIEPTPKVLETFVLPLNYTPKLNGGGGRIRTAEPGGSGFTVRRV